MHHSVGCVLGLALVAVVQSQLKTMVERLLPHADAKAENSLALQWASALNNEQMVELLLPVSDAKAAVKAMRDNPDIRWRGTPETLLLDVLQRKKQEKKLTAATKNKGEVVGKRKM